ncbi:MAG: hypothetical protein JSS11_01230 [Verrucomicrobia bacterium]|nr:hypothetical protein [Verrucomicrobiota bacterium]
MIRTLSLPSFRVFRRTAGAVLLGLLLSSTLEVKAAGDNQLDEKISTELQKLQPFVDAKNWDGALGLINSLKPLAAADSYDQAVLSDITYKIYMQKSDYQKAIAPLEEAIRLADTYNYFDANQTQEMVLYLAQVYYQEAVGNKSKALQQQYYAKAIFYMQRWIKASDKPKTDSSYQDAMTLYATLLYQQATMKEPADAALIAEAQKVIHEALLTVIHPKDTYYVMLLASYQQQNDLVKSAELLEFLAKNYPSRKDYWQQLFGTYLNLAGNQKDEETARMYNIRAILTIERAQAKGLMEGPKDYMNLVSIYFTIGQFGKAIEVLHKGLKDGTIEQVQKNWELLAYSYQQINQPLNAVNVLKEATQRFPRSGQLDYQIAQIYYSLDNTQETYNSLKLALAKGNLEKAGSVSGFLAYVCFELRKFDEALAAATKALASPDTKSDAQLPKLKQAIEDSIKEREATAESLKKKTK